MSEYKPVPLKTYKEFSEKKMIKRSEKFLRKLERRRTVRHFSDKPVPKEIIENCIKAAGTAPSGANMQPWHFVVISDPEIKRQIREAAELEEREFYNGKAPKEWIDALKHLGTDEHKPFLETAPYLIVIFERKYQVEGEKTIKHYYTKESVGLASGFLIAAVHNAGLVSLTHTPSPMNFLSKLLGRPQNEKPYLILVVGYPAEYAEVPDITKKDLEEIAEFI